jgi:hypothetical protein
MPFLVLLLIPIMKVVRGSKDTPALAMLLVTPLTCVAYYSYAFLELMGGGLSLNARYYLKCLPFVSILTAYALRELELLWGKPWRFVLAVALAAACVFFLFTQYLPRTWARMEFLVVSRAVSVGGPFTGHLGHRGSCGYPAAVGLAKTTVGPRGRNHGVGGPDFTFIRLSDSQEVARDSSTLLRAAARCDSREFHHLC